MRYARLVLDAELGVDGANMVAHGIGRKAKVAGHFLVGLALAEALGHVVFPWAELGQGTVEARGQQQLVAHWGRLDVDALAVIPALIKRHRQSGATPLRPFAEQQVDKTALGALQHTPGVAHRQGQIARAGQGFTHGHQGADLVCRDRRHQMQHQVIEQLAILHVERGRSGLAVERQVVAEVGLRVDMDHTQQFTQAVALPQPIQGAAVGGVAHIDNYCLARRGMHPCNGNVQMADRLPVRQVVGWQLIEVAVVLLRQTVDDSRASPPGTVEGQQLADACQGMALEVFDVLMLGQALQVQGQGAEGL